MYDSEKRMKWHATSASRMRRKIGIRRVYAVWILAALFFTWRLLRKPQSVNKNEQQWMTLPSAYSLATSDHVHARDFAIAKATSETTGPVTHEDLSSSDSVDEQEPSPQRTLVQQLEDDKVVEQLRDSAPELRRSVAETRSGPVQELVTIPGDKVSDNVTPEEQDDGEEPALKGIAVASKGKEPPSNIAMLSEKSQQQVLGEPNGDSKSSTAAGRAHAYDGTQFPPHSQFEILDALADTLPDVVHINFEDSTSDVVLKGWEDQWFSDGTYDFTRWGALREPKIDFIYTWVNGSEKAFQDTIAPYELRSSLNEADGKWLEHHRTNRYRDWDELRYSIRTVERYASSFRNKFQILVNAVGPEGDSAMAEPEKPSKIVGKQMPLWIDYSKQATKDNIQILAQEDFFSEKEQGCLPTFNSLTIENQIHNTKSNVDRFFALSDDMLLGKPHAASDLYSPLFGPTMGFKTNAYNTREPPTDTDARRFGEKPYLIYTSWLLNRRFGERKRKGQVHFGHSMSRSVTREAINTFPRPALQSNCQRFRGETGFQLYSWYVTFHYTMERQREALLWSYIMKRSDMNQDGNIDWAERQAIMADLEDGMANESNSTFRTRIFYQVPELLEDAGLEAPKVNMDVLWTSLDGPSTIRDIECAEFNVNECMAPGFSMQLTDKHFTNPAFSAASIFDRVARQHPKCGDCLIKLILNRAPRGLAPLLPRADKQSSSRETVIKALLKYQYIIVEPNAQFVMVTDAQQVKNVLLRRLVNDKKDVGQLCLNDDVATDDPNAIEELRKTIKKFFKGFAPGRSEYELQGS